MKQVSEVISDDKHPYNFYKMKMKKIQCLYSCQEIEHINETSMVIKSFLSEGHLTPALIIKRHTCSKSHWRNGFLPNPAVFHRKASKKLGNLSLTNYMIPLDGCKWDLTYDNMSYKLIFDLSKLC